MVSKQRIRKSNEICIMYMNKWRDKQYYNRNQVNSEQVGIYKVQKVGMKQIWMYMNKWNIYKQETRKAS